MSLADELDALTQGLRESATFPKPVLDAIFGHIQEQIKGGQADRAVLAGKVAPSFRLKDAKGKTFDSHQLLAKGPLVLKFFRGVWCPYCNLELRALEAVRPEIEARGATIVALSMQDGARADQTESKNDLGFPVLIDLHGDIADRFGLRFNLPPELIEIYKAGGNDLGVMNGEESWTLPIPALYVIGEDGVVAYAELNTDFTKRAEPSDLYPVLDKLKSGGFSRH